MGPSATVQAEVEELGAALGHPVLIEDARHQPLWWSVQGDEVDGTRLRTILQRECGPAAIAVVARLGLARAVGPVRTPAAPEAEMLPRWCVPLRSGRDLLGYLWVLDGEGTVTETDLPKLVACAEVATSYLAQDQLTDAERARRRDALLARLAEGPDEDAARELVALEVLRPDVKVSVQAPAASDGWLFGSVSVHIGPVATPTSGAPLPLLDLRTALHRADVTRRALLAGAQLTRPTWDALGSWHLVVSAPPALTVANVHPGADVLARLPRPDLLHTARVVLDLGGDVSQAAAELHIHRTTLYYRLDRIEALTGVNLRTGPGREDLHLALRLAAFRATI
jgi:hypothetical protein